MPLCPLRISEILYDPDPPLGLPGFEYVEWHNPGPDTVDLVGWGWVVGEEVEGGKISRVGKGVTIGPGEFVIACGKSAAPSFQPLGKVIVLDPFPVLKNGGDRLTLLDPAGNVVHSVYYSPDLFPDALKANGGWSLELTDLNAPCSEAAWMPSEDPSGGTPGRANSLMQNLLQESPPVLLRAGLYDSGRIFVLFSGPLATGPGMNNEGARLQPGGMLAEAIRSPLYGFPGLFFRLPGGLADTSAYTLELEGPVWSCDGQEALLKLAGFSLPQIPDSASVVINEIMFDPGSGKPEWVELYNRGHVAVELNDLLLARADTTGRVLSFSDSQELPFLLMPGCYAVLTASSRKFCSTFQATDPALIAGRSDLPALTNEAAQLILLDRSQRVIDQVVYNPAWHYPYLAETIGVSIERIDPDVSGMVPNNWFSAGRIYGDWKCTPGYRNSQYPNHPSLSLTTPPTFSLLTPYLFVNNLSDPQPIVVQYRFDEPGWFCGLFVHDSRGARVKEAVPFGLAGTKGVLTWDGLDDRLSQVADGIYLLIAEYRNPMGKAGRWKKACGVVRVH